MKNFFLMISIFVLASGIPSFAQANSLDKLILSDAVFDSTK